MIQFLVYLRNAASRKNNADSSDSSGGDNSDNSGTESDNDDYVEQEINFFRQNLHRDADAGK